MVMTTEHKRAKIGVINIKNIYLHILVFTLIYIEFGYLMVVTGAVSGSIRMMILLAITFPLLFMIKSISRLSLNLIIYLLVLILVNSVRDTSLENSILLIIPIFIGFVIASSIKFLDLVKVFNSIVVFLAAFSLATFFISLFFPNIIASLPSLGQVYNSRASMHNAIFSVCISNSETVRNYGITWEPGAFSILLSLSLFSLLAFEEKPSKLKLSIIIVALITTFSTMGYFVMAGILLSFSLKQSGTNNKIKNYAFLILGSFIILMMVLPSSITDIVFKKLSGLFSEGEDIAYTTLARLNAIIYPFEAFWSSPIIGVGYDKFSIINKELCDGVATNTILNWFASMGLLLGIPCTCAYIKFAVMNAKTAKINFLGKILIVISAVLLVSTESLLRISLIYVFIFYATKHKDLI